VKVWKYFTVQISIHIVLACKFSVYAYVEPEVISFIFVGLPWDNSVKIFKMMKIKMITGCYWITVYIVLH